MVRAYVMVKVAAGEADPLVEAVRSQQHVTEAHVVAGDYDVIAEAEAPEVADLLGPTVDGIRGLADVVDTRTYICLE